jgi:hypothetical protein
MLINVNRIGSIVLIALCIAGFSGGAAFSSSQKPKERFDPDGAFWIQGTPPTGFTEIGGINLNSRRRKQFPVAGVEIVNGKRLGFKTLTVNRQTLSFTTVVLGGISYTFAGTFLKGGVFSSGELDQETPVLEGTLTKFQRGRKVAEAKLKFTYFGGT